ncbi:MAG: nucleotidyltransferase domain-containing protein [Polyangiaceae bacterium]|nr:nucleotidyltransferase domain-containing protein [Polyangiaceae bacterium]
MGIERFGGLRARIAAEAARLMYEEGVKQYFTAKRLAANRLLGKVAGKRMRYRPQDLPSNGEIRDALLLLADLAEGEKRHRKLFAMRAVALEVMEEILPFEPRLIGSVSTGHVRRGSDIDIQVFTNDEDALERHLTLANHLFERERVSILKFGQVREYLHLHLVDAAFPVELTVYERNELRFRPKSSTDGKPIVRVSAAALRAILIRDHQSEFDTYLTTGTIVGLEEAQSEQEDENRPGPWDGLLAQEPDNLPMFTEEPDDDYDPLPGFEQYS